MKNVSVSSRVTSLLPVVLWGLSLERVCMDGRQIRAVAAFAPEGLEESGVQALVTGGAL